jgi:hypothetical protein
MPRPGSIRILRRFALTGSTTAFRARHRLRRALPPTPTTTAAALGTARFGVGMDHVGDELVNRVTNHGINRKTK